MADRIGDDAPTQLENVPHEPCRDCFPAMNMGKLTELKQRVRQMADRRTIIVTGCSSGIGAYCARQLAADGWRVFATARKPDDLRALEADGLEALYLDYREPDSIAALADTVLARTGGRLDALFNNGAHGQAGAVEDLPVEALREQFEVTVVGWHDLTRRVIPAMRRQGHGRIVQCSSILGLLPYPWRGAYNAAKHALEALSLTMRMELKGSGNPCQPDRARSRSNPASPRTGLVYFRKYIDAGHSVHAAEYGARSPGFPAAASSRASSSSPTPSMRSLSRRWKRRNPRPHYVVTQPARAGALMKRLLRRQPYDFLARRA